MNEGHGYKLRPGNSPYRRTSASPRRRKNSQVSSDEKIIYDSVYVATYNDNPEHMYGLDKDTEEKLCEALQAHKKSISHKKKRNLFTVIKRRLLKSRWQLITLYFVIAAIILEGCRRTFYTDTTQKIITNENRSDEMIQRLIDQVNGQKEYMEDFTSKMKQLQNNCSSHEILFNGNKSQKGTVERMQEQILTTLDLVKSLNQRMTILQQAVHKQEQMNAKKENKNGLCQGEDCKFPSRNMFAAIQAALETYNADVIGLTDFALESAGGSIHGSYHSDTCDVGAPIIKVFGLPLWQDPRSPRTIIQSDRAAGKCWPMKGTSGYIVIKLATQIYVTMFSLEHLDERLDKYSNNIYQSAPKDFEVFAWLDKEGRMKILLGSYVFTRDKSPIQTYKVQVKFPKAISYIELRILSNYGNKDCTCLYRFRVHGASKEWGGL